MDSDLAAVVIDNGSSMCKAGFAGDDAPRSVFPSIVGRPTQSTAVLSDPEDVYIGDNAQLKRDVLTINHPIRRGIITDWHDMETIWHHAYSTELRVDSAEHAILLTDAPFVPNASREKMAQVMFESFNVPAFHVVNQAALSLPIASGHTTGIVVDCGYDASYAVPIYQGSPLPHATLRLDVAGRDVTYSLVKSLIERGYSITTAAARDVVLEVKKKLCYVALDFEQECRTADFPFRALELSHELPDGRIIELSHERYLAPEVLFRPSLIGIEAAGIDKIVHDSILTCDPDLQPSLYRTIMLSGGSTLLPGFVDRMQKELTTLSPFDEKVNIIADPSRKYSTWIGGSIVASLSTFPEMCVSKQEYDETGPGIVRRKCFI